MFAEDGRELPEIGRSVEIKISQLLNGMGITASIKGYHYLRTGILMALQNREALEGVTKVMYPGIARTYQTSSSKVERAIRHAITSSWERGGDRVFGEVLGCGLAHRPTNSQFIAVVSEFLRATIPEQMKKV